MTPTPSSPSARPCSIRTALGHGPICRRAGMKADNPSACCRSTSAPRAKRTKVWPLAPRTTGASIQGFRSRQEGHQGLPEVGDHLQDRQELARQDMGFTTPFKSFTTSSPTIRWSRPLLKIRTPARPISWNFTMMPSEEWKNKLGSALLEYAQGPAAGTQSRRRSWTVGRPSTTLFTDHRLIKPITE